MKNKKMRVIMITAVAVMILAGLVCFASCNKMNGEQSEQPTTTVEATKGTENPTETATPSEAVQNSPETAESVSSENPEKPVKSESVKPVSPEKPEKTQENKKKEPPKPTETQKQNKPAPKPEPSVSQKPTKPEHQHTWVDITEERKVLVKDAWDEDVYEERDRTICNVCGKDISGNVTAHQKAHALAGEGSGYHVEWYEVKTGTIHHDAEYKTETVVVGKKCSVCGATK